MTISSSTLSAPQQYRIIVVRPSAIKTPIIIIRPSGVSRSVNVFVLQSPPRRREKTIIAEVCERQNLAWAPSQPVEDGWRLDGATRG